MVLKKFDILDPLPPESRYPDKQSIVTIAPRLELIRSPLESGNDVLASGFDKSCVKDDKGRKGRNPTAGKDTILPARRLVAFKRSGKSWEKVNQKQ